LLVLKDLVPMHTAFPFWKPNNLRM